MAWEKRQYSSDSPGRAADNKLRIEVQIRSRAQPAWATALETVDTFTSQALKANRGKCGLAAFLRTDGAFYCAQRRTKRRPWSAINKMNAAVSIPLRRFHVVVFLKILPALLAPSFRTSIPGLQTMHIPDNSPTSSNILHLRQLHIGLALKFGLYRGKSL
jgi:hypothetical protein